jgi:hypothetical protein
MRRRKESRYSIIAAVRASSDSGVDRRHRADADCFRAAAYHANEKQSAISLETGPRMAGDFPLLRMTFSLRL